MRFDTQVFKGLAPTISNRLLPPGYASICINANLISGDLASFADIGNSFSLAKAAPINTIWLMKGPAPNYWLQWSQSEVGYGSNIDASLGTIPGDTTYRTYITGLASGPVQTNLYYATDPSQQGGSTQYAYPYVTFPLGITNPTVMPTVVPPVASGSPAVNWEYAQEAASNLAVVASLGSGYVVGDILTGLGGTIVTGLLPVRLKVTSVNGSGGITGVSALTATIANGYYTAGSLPSSPMNVSGGSGSGATFIPTPVGQQIIGFGFNPYSGSGSSFSSFGVSGNYWQIAIGQGANGNGFVGTYSIDPISVQGTASVLFQVDVNASGAANGHFPDIVASFAGTFNGSSSVSGPAVVLSVEDGTLAIYNNVTTGANGLAFTAPREALAGYAFSPYTFYRLFITITPATGTSTAYTVTVTVATQAAPGSSLLPPLSATVSANGTQFGLGVNTRYTPSGSSTAQFENILIASTPAVTSVNIAVATAYTYTYVTTKGSGANSITEESGPAPYSSILNYYLNSSTNPETISPVSLTIPACPAGQYITNYNIYRKVTLSDGSVVSQFVAQVAANSSNPVAYTDTTLDANLGNDLITTLWQPPVSNLQGILALPNGIMAGFYANTLALSVQTYPFAWPSDYEYTVDSPIVAIAAIDSTVLILTKDYPYTAWGTDPSNYSMSKEVGARACVSKRSVVTHTRLGVIFAADNGLCYFRGQGELDLLRMPGGEPWFTIEQWLALNPSSIMAVLYNDMYVFYYKTVSGINGCYALDLSAANRGLISLDIHATAAYIDRFAGYLYFCLDSSTIPVNGSLVASAQNVINQWEGGTGLRARTWERQEILLPKPASMMLAQIDAEDYSNISLTLASENGTSYNGAVTSAQPFILSSQIQPGRRWSITLTGTSQINRFQVCESASELLPG